MEKVENIEQLPKCETHLCIMRICTTCNKNICTQCIMFNKEEIKHYKEHFSAIKNPERVNIEKYAEDLHDYEGFEILNKVYKKFLKIVEDNIDSVNEKIFINKDMMIKRTKDLLVKHYQKRTEEFEAAVKLVTSTITNLDTKDQAAKDEYKKIKADLDEKTELLDNKEKLEAEFNKIIQGVTNKYERMKISNFVEEPFNLYIGNHGESLDLIACNGPVVKTQGGRSGTYWCVRSEEILSGEFTAKIKVLQINSSKAKGSWGYTVGICRKNSTLVDNYYTESILLSANGFLANKFTATSNFKKLYTDLWVEGDIITVKRDLNNKIYFGLNATTNEELIHAFDDITGEFRIVIGFTASSSDDSFELLEIS